jgi:hypothetical protein
MTDRIQELIDQATSDIMGVKVLDKRMFAELIVRECANRATWAQDTSAVDIGGEVLKHFGVEE